MKKIAIMAFATLLSACSILPTQPVSGTYKGTLPCADCEKIEALLVLNDDKSYEYNTVYFKRGEQFPFSEKGTYSQKASVVHLENSGDLRLKVNSQYAEFCDENGHTVDNENNYKLMKQ